MAEGRALRDGLQVAVEAGYKQLHIEGDNLILIEAVKGESTIPWRLKYAIHDIRMMLSQLDDVQVNHIYREANIAADWLAKYDHSITGQKVTVDPGNSDFRRVISDDMLGDSLVRRYA